MSFDDEQVKFNNRVYDKLKELEQKLSNALEKGTAVAFHNVYHESNNKRIKNLCHAIGMDLNGKTSSKIEALEDSLQKCGVKWDFRLDELNGFITEMKEQREEDIKLSLTNYDRSFNNIKVLREVMNRLDLDFEDLFDKLDGDKVSTVEDAIETAEKLIKREKKRYYYKTPRAEGMLDEDPIEFAGVKISKEDFEKAKAESLQPHKEYPSSARLTERKCENCRFGGVECEEYIDECDDHNKWEPIKKSQVQKEDLSKEKLIPLIASIIEKESIEGYCQAERIAEFIYNDIFKSFKLVASEDLQKMLSWMPDSYDLREKYLSKEGRQK